MKLKTHHWPDIKVHRTKKKKDPSFGVSIAAIYHRASSQEKRHIKSKGGYMEAACCLNYLNDGDKLETERTDGCSILGINIGEYNLCASPEVLWIR